MLNQHFKLLLIISLGFLGLLILSSSFQVRLNHLSRDEKKEGWKLLFDGKSTKGWHVFQKQGVMNPQWKIEEGTLTLAGKGGGDICTDEEFENFDLSLEWKISPKGNSGIFFNVSEDTSYKAVWKTGPEMQILDDEGHPDGKFPKHRAGANYDLSIPLVKSVRAVGEWNHVRILVNQGNVSYYLNGQLTTKYTLWSPEWEKLVKESKFKDMPGYGQIRKGKIALQDHGDQVWFRNIKIKPL
jgi:hypothetical protein